MTVFFMNEKNPRVSNREERGWRRRPTPSPGSGPAGREQPPGERRPERPLRSRSFPPSRGGFWEKGAPGSGTGWRPLAAAEGGNRDRDSGWGERDGGRPAGRARGRPLFLSNFWPPPWRDPPPLLRLRRRIPGPDCISFQPLRLHLSRCPPPAPHSSQGAL